MNRKSISIGIDIGKRKYDYCVIDANGKVFERVQYLNATGEATKIAATMARKYMGHKD